jgi:ribonucleoside-diphosphate reductase beta chain
VYQNDVTMLAEHLLTPEEKRTNLFPIRYPDMWDKYKEALACLWVAGEVDLSRDREDWNSLNEGERHFVSMILAFFANADGIVNDNLVDRFCREVQIREARCFYDLQRTMENIHNEMYSLLIDTYIEDDAQRNRLFHATDNFDCVNKKAAWAQRWIDSTDSVFAERLVAFAVVEGVFFSGSFCAIFWLKSRGLLKGLCESNTLISRDEGMHQTFATMLYKDHIQNRLSDDCVHTIVRDAVGHEKEFICEAIPVSLIGMNKDSMSTYIEYVADRLLVELGHSKLYHSECPFDFMKLQGMETKTNFFESRETTYQKKGARVVAGDHTFSLDAPF